MSLEIIDNPFMVCTDCLMIIANDEASGLDYSLSEEEAAEREREICKAITEAQPTKGQVAIGYREMEEELSTSPCPRCGTRLAAG